MSKENEEYKGKSRRAPRIGLQELLSYFTARWYWLALSAVLFTVLGFLYARIKAPIYQVDANIRISQDEAGGLLSIAGFSDLFGGGNSVEDEVFVVQSHSVLRDVVEDNRFYIDHYVREGFMQTYFNFNSYPVEVIPPVGIQDTLRKTLGFKIKVNKAGKADITMKAGKDKCAKLEDATFPINFETPYGLFVFVKTDNYPVDESVTTSIVVSSLDAKAEALSSQLDISVANRQSNVISLSYKSPSVAYAKLLINSIIEQYNKRGIEDKNTQASLTLNFIDNRLDLITEALATSEDEVAQYKRDNKITDLQADATYDFNQKGQLETQLISTGNRLEILGMTRDFLRKPENAFSLLPVAGEVSGLNDALTKYNELVLNYMTLSSTAKGNNATLKTLEEQITAMRLNILKSVERSYSQQQAVYTRLEQEINNTDSKLNSLPAKERKYIDIMRQREIKEQLYVFLLQRREETAMMMANALPKGIIIDEAYALNEPVGMSPKILMAATFMFGLLFPAFFFYVRLLMRNKFVNRAELEKETDIAILGEVCTAKSGNPIVVRPGRTSSISELFRLIRTNLSFVVQAGRSNTILVTSTRSGEGKSFIAINIGASISLADKKVLLIGMDIRKPMLEEYLGLDHRPGLTQYLSSNEVKVDDIIRRKPIADLNLDIITAGPIPPNPGELLLSKHLDDLFEELHKRYDYIIIDSAPVGMVSDTFTLARLTDATVYVCRANYTTLDDIEFTNRLKESGRLPNMSLVINGTKKQKGYGYGYGNVDEE